MNLTIYPGYPLQGEVELPGDKSLSHRAALFAALACGQSRIDHFLDSGVTRAMLDALSALQIPWQLEDGALIVEGPGWEAWKPPIKPIYCGNSATTLRLLAGALAAAGVPAVLDGSEGLRRRPMDRIVEPLRRMGVPVESAAGGCAPLALAYRPPASPLRAMVYSLPVASAQVKTCLLLTGLAAEGPVILHEPELSRDHTERMLASMGVEISSQDTTITLQPPTQPLRPFHVSLPGDFSSAAFLMVAALITPGSEIILRDVGLNPTRTGLLDALLAMGAKIEITARSERAGEPAGNLRVCHSRLHGTRVAGDLVVRMIDEFPAFAIAAAFAQGQTEVFDAVELRHKESDRITSLCDELQALGVQVDESPDGFAITGCPAVEGGRVRSHGDHRLAMSLAMAGLASRRPVIVEGAEMIRESYPEFASVLARCGAQISLEN